MCNGISADVTPCNMVGLSEIFSVSGKVEPLSTFATVATIAVVTETRV